jgi:hypothetical protein
MPDRVELARQSCEPGQAPRPTTNPVASAWGGRCGHGDLEEGIDADADKRPACLMTIMKRSESRLVTGMWKSGGVSRWTFGRLSPASNLNPLEANVRLLPDGRVTKIYR